MSDLTIQRRTQRRIVKFQSRLEAGAGDRWIPLLVGAALAAVLVWLSLGRVDSFESGGDLPGYAQAIWLIGQGFTPEATLFGDDVHLLERHWSGILYALVPFTWLFSAARVLVVAQALALGLAVVPLWRIARRVAKLRVGAASALVLAYALHPATHRLGVTDFHPESLAIPGILFLAYFGATKRWVWYWVAVAVVLLCRADLGLAVGLWGFVLLGDGERRAGLWTLGVGLLWALGLLLVVQPLVGEASLIGGQYGSYGDSLGEVLLNVVSNPIELLRDLTAQANVNLLVSLLAPVLFLPLLSIRYLLPAVPLAGLFLIANIDGTGEFGERTALLLAFMFVAAPHALDRLGNMGVNRVFVDVRLLTTIAAAAALSFVSTSPTSLYQQPWQWGTPDATEQAIIDAAAQLDTDVAVRASPSALVELAERTWLYPLETSRPPTVQFDAIGVRALLIVDRDIPERTAQERDDFTRSMAERAGFDLIIDDRENGVALFFRP